MMIHLQNTPVADGTVVNPGCLWCNTLLAHGDSGRYQAALRRHTWGCDDGLVVVKGDVEQQPVADDD